MRQIAGTGIMVALVSLAAATLAAQQPGVHYWHHGDMPPGAIGAMQLSRGGPLQGYFQPVEIRAPQGVRISLARENTFDEPPAGPRKTGLLVGCVYRLRVTGIPRAEGQEVYPTLEVINRLYAPLGMQQRFAIPVELTEEDLNLALDGKFVTRIIYLEDPRKALPIGENPQTQNYFETAPGQDPLAVADALGRPMAILRLGGRLPPAAQQPEDSFFYGSPPFIELPVLRQTPPRPRVPMANSTRIKGDSPNFADHADQRRPSVAGARSAPVAPAKNGAFPGNPEESP
jgi:hypothetical protein